MANQSLPENTSESKSLLTGFVSLGVFIVLLLMGAVYWASLDLFSRTIERAGTLRALLEQHEFYAGIIGISIGVTAIVILLYSIRVTRRLSRAIKHGREMSEGTPHDRRQIRRWLYQQVKWRIMGLIAAGSSIIFILMSSLYTATLYSNITLTSFAPEQLEALLRILRYNGMIVLMTTGIALITLLLSLSVLLKRLVGVIDVNQTTSGGGLNLTDLPRLLFNLDSEKLVDQLKEKQFKAHLNNRLEHDEEN